MPSMAWFHSGADTILTGELRLLGLPALLLEESGWTSSFRSMGAEGGAPADVAVMSASTLGAIAQTSRWPRPPVILVSLDDEAIGRDAEQLDALRLAAGRIDAVVARGPVALAWARDNLGERVRCAHIPDIAEREPEVRAAAMRFGMARRRPVPRQLDYDRFWYAGPGDLVDEEEVAFLLAACHRAQDRGQRMLVAAPQAILDWLRQAGLPAAVQALPWSAGLIGQLLEGTAPITLPDSRNARRRQAKLARHRGYASPGVDLARFEPRQVAARWRELLDTTLVRPAVPAVRRTLLMFLDLIQDLELALPILRAALRRPDLTLRVAATRWLRDNNPRFAPSLQALGIAPEYYDRKAVMAGHVVPLEGVDALLTIVETTLNAHKRAHAVTLEAQGRDIPTFTMQHGLENVGLTYFDDVHDRSVDIRSDHILAWFPADRTPAVVPARVRPRLVHVGRPRMDSAEVPPVPAHPGTRIVAVFENLHWDRYSKRYRDQFMADCFRLAEVLEDTVVVIKPHPAGKWLTKSRDQIETWPVNIMVADPEDPLWHGSTAGSLIAIADAVVTTPSSVAVDAALEGKRVAVAGYDVDVSAYTPLPILRSFDDWLGFAVARDSGVRAAQARARFLARIDMPGPSEERLLDAIEGVIAARLIAPAHSASA